MQVWTSGETARLLRAAALAINIFFSNNVNNEGTSAHQYNKYQREQG
jgi:hypothetical protein